MNRYKGRKLGLLLAVLLLGVLGWFVVVRREETRKLTYVIPPGTGQQIEAGRSPVSFPDEIILTVGMQDTIIIKNQDDVVHTFGPFIIAPHATLTKRFETAVVYEGACTFHQEQQMRLIVKPAPWDVFQ